MRSAARRSSLALLLVALLAGPAAIPASAKASAPRFQMPFVCGEYRRASTSPAHKPNRLAIDLNIGYGDQDLGSIVVASAGGRVHLRKASWMSYGKFIVIDHGRGWQTIYAHLGAFAVRNGARVHRGDKIGSVGNNKSRFLAHLHYEQRYRGVLQRIRFGGHRIAYRDNPRYVVYKSANNCRAKPALRTKATSTLRRAKHPSRTAVPSSTDLTRTGATHEGGPVFPILPFVVAAFAGSWWISRRVDRMGRA